MNKVLLIILIAGLSGAPAIKGQQRNSGNTTGRTPAPPAYRSGYSNSLAPSGTVQRQTSIPNVSDWKAMDIQEKKEVVSSMSQKDRWLFLQKVKEDIVIDNLHIPKDKEVAFKTLYAEYQDNQKQIKEKFSVDKNTQNLSDAEAKNRLDQSFEVGRQLLDNRRAYANQFLKFLTPQQVLTLFQTEGKMRDKVLDKKNNK
ncbi:MAG: hypothetical protein L6262_09580 [Weeksellaceae bacterium]|nr:hypothetical protein [Weeksellaceae bacterium]